MRKTAGIGSKPIKVIEAADLVGSGGRYKLYGEVAVSVVEDSTGPAVGGPAQAVYVLTAADIASGKYKVGGGAAIRVRQSVAGDKVDGRYAIPVYDVDGALGSSAAQTYAQKVLSYSPIAYWTLGETSGTVAACEVNAAQNGTYARDVSAMGTATGIGDGNAAPVFDGTNDVVDVYSAALNTAFNGQLGSMSGWCKIPNAGDWGDFSTRASIRILANANSLLYHEKHLLPGNFELAYIAGIANKSHFADVGSSTTWYHVAMTWTLAGDELKFFVNGAQFAGTFNTLGTWAGVLDSSACCIGASTTAPIEAWKGHLAHYALWDSVLSGPDILELATV